MKNRLIILYIICSLLCILFMTQKIEALKGDNEVLKENNSTIEKEFHNYLESMQNEK